MKWKTLFLFFLGIAWSTKASVQNDTEIEKELLTVDLFSIGLNGFVAKKMPQQLIYEKVLENTNSVSIFEKILESHESTPEGKAYSACGLWENRKPEKIKLKDEYSDLNVTILSGDILRQESLGEFIGNINKHGCK